MVNRVKCFMVELTGTVDIQLRRYHSSPLMKSCNVHAYGYHNAQVIIDTKSAQISEEGYYKALETDHNDLRWPVSCVCGYKFLDSDVWQTNQIRIFRNVETKEEYSGPTHKLPVGAMWYVETSDWPWYFKNPQDGKILAMMTPGGEWIIDGTASNGPKDAAGWTRTGIPPLVIVRPSIQAGPYHGFLGGPSGDQPGYLVEC